MPEKNFELAAKRCTLGIINNRIEKNGDQDVTAFDLPITLLLDPDELNALLGDKYKHRALFETKNGVSHPMFPEFESFALKEDRQGDVTLHLAGETEVEYEDVRLKSLTLSPVAGGETELRCKVQVLPQTKHITKLINAQNCELKISVADTKIAAKNRSKQQDLPLDPVIGSTAGSLDEHDQRAGGPGAETMGRHANGTPADDAKEFEAAAQTQVAAFKAKRGKVIDGSSAKSRRRRADTGAH